MGIKFSVLLVLAVALDKTSEGVHVHKVKSGETAILSCPSEDKIHRFQYWLLKNNDIIGPWNNNAGNKLGYEVWSGRLIIKSVSEEETGLYTCFSKRIIGNQIKSESVELLVLKDWVESSDNGTKVNTYTLVIFVFVLLIIVVGVISLLLKRQRKLSSKYEESKRDSPDLLDPSSSSGVYRPTRVGLRKPSPKREMSVEKGLENVVVETDISKSLSSAT